MKNKNVEILMRERGFKHRARGVYVALSKTPAQDSVKWNEDASNFGRKFEEWKGRQENGKALIKTEIK